MLEHLRGKASERKLRLIVCAAARAMWDRLNEANRQLVRAVEADPARLPEEDPNAGWWGLMQRCDPGRALATAGGGVRRPARLPPAGQCAVVREIAGNPFRPAPLGPAWLTADASALAQAAYDERGLPSGELDPERLAILADALEEAGCTDQTVLDHLRSSGPHVRGCWALDLILGKY
jgi:hypothetical protein